MSKIIVQYSVATQEEMATLLGMLKKQGCDTNFLLDAPDPTLLPVWVKAWSDKTVSMGKSMTVVGDETVAFDCMVVAFLLAPSYEVNGVIIKPVSQIPENKTVLEEAQKLIYGDRQAAYGSVTTNFTNIANGWATIFGTTVTPEQVGLAMAWVKICRQVNKPSRDNLVDLAGYAGCIAKMEGEKI